MTDRKTCNIAIPVQVPPGYSVSLFKYDYRGEATIPHDASGRFTTEYFFAGSNGPRMDRQFPAGFDDAFTFTDNVVGAAMVWSPCGREVMLRSNTVASVRSSFMPGFSNGNPATITIDSADITGQVALKYVLKWRACQA